MCAPMPKAEVLTAYCLLLTTITYYSRAHAEGGGGDDHARLVVEPLLVQRLLGLRLHLVRVSSAIAMAMVSRAMAMASGAIAMVGRAIAMASGAVVSHSHGQYYLVLITFHAK